MKVLKTLDKKKMNEFNQFIFEKQAEILSEAFVFLTAAFTEEYERTGECPVCKGKKKPLVVVP